VAKLLRPPARGSAWWWGLGLLPLAALSPLLGCFSVMLVVVGVAPGERIGFGVASGILWGLLGVWIVLRRRIRRLSPGSQRLLCAGVWGGSLLLLLALAG